MYSKRRGGNECVFSGMHLEIVPLVSGSVALATTPYVSEA